jgi:hypothetical protein
MAVDPVFRNDKLEVQVRKCIVFPADGSETRIVHMNARTVIGKDITSYSRSLDMTSAFGDDCRKMRVAAHRSARNGVQSTYLFFYNLSPNLPINLNVAHLIGVTPSHLKIKKRLFWRGDVVAMKVQPESERIDFIIESMDADLLELGSLEEFLRERYQEGVFERLLHNNELECEQESGQRCRLNSIIRTGDFYLSSFCGPSSLLLGPPKSYWGENAAKKEGKRGQQLLFIRI